MGTLNPLASVSDVALEFNATGGGPYTIFSVAGVTSGQIYDKITEANATLQGWVSIGTTPTPSDPAMAEAQKRFEVAYASARLAADLMGGVITDGFNYTLEGTSINRFGAQFQTYNAFIKNHLDVAKYYITMLHQWFIVYGPSFPQGINEYGNPVGYSAVNTSRWG
jgi:hypothetical protein